MKILISEIKVGDRIRQINKDKVKQIAESMKVIGQLSPIILNEDNELVAGAHRLEAAKMLGLTEINYEIANYDFVLNNLAIDLGPYQRPVKCSKCNNEEDLTIEKIRGGYWWKCQSCNETYPIELPSVNLIKALSEIDENLMRNNLSIVQEGEYLSKRDAIIEALGKGGKIDVGMSSVGVGGLSEKSKSRRKKVVNGINEEVLDLVKDTPLANNQSELLKLVKLSKVDQAEFINQFTLGVVHSVDEFLANKTQASLSNLTIPEIHLADYNLAFDDIRDKTIDLIVTQPDDVGSDDYIENVLAACLPKVKLDGRCFLFIDASPNVINKYLEKFYSGRNNWAYLDIINVAVWTYRNFEHQSGVPGLADNFKFILHIAGDDVPNLTASGSSLNSIMEYNAVVNELGVTFPDTMANKIIGMASKEGATVFDPYMKSVVVLKIASVMGRKSIGYSEDTDSTPKWVGLGYRIKNGKKGNGGDGVF